MDAIVIYIFFVLGFDGAMLYNTGHLSYISTDEAGKARKK